MRSVSAKSLGNKSDDKDQEKQRDKSMMTMSRSVSGIVRHARIQPDFLAHKSKARKGGETGVEPEMIQAPPKLELTKTPPINWDDLD
jgi:hypothetical protein